MNSISSDLVIFDLDGTVLSINSFRPWAAHLLAARFPHLGRVRRLGVALAAAGALAARKSGLLDHETLKWRLQRLWQNATEEDGGAAEEAFARRLAGYVRPELAGLLQAVALGEIEAVLATAAAADYAHALGERLGFRHILATPRLRDRGTASNIGERKRDAVLDFIERRGWQRRRMILFTDHRDDLPLIRICPLVYWFGPESERTALLTELPGADLRPGSVSAEILARTRNGQGAIHR